MEKISKKNVLKKTSGWLLVGLGTLWAFSVLLTSQQRGVDISITLGAVTIPILIILLGLYFVGIIKKAK